MYQITEASKYDVPFIWAEFHDWIPKAFSDVSDGFDLYEAMKNWHCFVVSSDKDICGLAFVSRSGGRVAVFHPVLRPTYLKNYAEIFNAAIGEVMRKSGVEMLLTHIPVGPHASWQGAAERLGFEWCGCIPRDNNNGGIDSVSVYKYTNHKEGEQNG